MSCQENDRIYEALYEDFLDLCSVSISFRLLVDRLELQLAEDWFFMRLFKQEGKDLLPYLFDCLWENDCELLCRDKRTAVEALIMFNETKRVMRNEKPL